MRGKAGATEAEGNGDVAFGSDFGTKNDPRFDFVRRTLLHNEWARGPPHGAGDDGAHPPLGRLGWWWWRENAIPNGAANGGSGAGGVGGVGGVTRAQSAR